MFKIGIIVVCSLVLGTALPVSGDLQADNRNSTLDAIKEMKDQLVRLVEENKKLAIRLSVLENVTSGVEHRGETNVVLSDIVGFTVQLDNHIRDLPLGSTVVFDGVWYNAGGGYNKTTGVFTCPRSGLYMFAVFVEAVNGQEPAAVQIIKNRSYRVSAVSELYANGHDSTGGNMMIEHMLKGDRVWVSTSYHDNQDLHRVFTSFSGVLIKSTA